MTSHTSSLVTVTPSPAIDRTYRVELLVPGEVVRAGEVSEEFAGKGVNVSRNLSLAGIHSPCVVPLSATDQRAWGEDPLLLASPCEGRLRVNITAIERGGRTTKINQSATPLQPEEWQQLRESTLQAVKAHDARWVLVAGRFPDGPGEDLFGPQALRDQLDPSVRIALDTSAPTLGHWARSGSVDFIKPNVSELQDTLGRPIGTLGEVVDAAREINSWGVGMVAVSLGAAGFLVVAHDELAWASAPVDQVTNTIGAGDASVAGFFASWLSGQSALSDAAMSAARWGALKVQQPTSQLHHLNNLPPASVRGDVDAALPVTAD